MSSFCFLLFLEGVIRKFEVIGYRKDVGASIHSQGRHSVASKSIYDNSGYAIRCGCEFSHCYSLRFFKNEEADIISFVVIPTVVKAVVTFEMLKFLASTFVLRNSCNVPVNVFSQFRGYKDCPAASVQTLYEAMLGVDADLNNILYNTLPFPKADDVVGSLFKSDYLTDSFSLDRVIGDLASLTLPR